VLEQRAVVLHRLLQLSRLVRRAETAPDDDVRARCDRGGRVDLEQRQPLHDADEAGRPGRVEQLRTHCDPACLHLGQPMHRAEAR
jgi:hypothetical protein